MNVLIKLFLIMALILSCGKTSSEENKGKSFAQTSNAMPQNSEVVSKETDANEQNLIVDPEGFEIADIKDLNLNSLLPERAMRDFEVGIPANEESTWRTPTDPTPTPCLIDGLDYSGADPAIQFPKYYHVKAGFGLAMGSYHQDANRFVPYKVKVMPITFANDVTKNVLRLEGNRDGKGTSELSYQLPKPIAWREGAIFQYKVRLLFRETLNAYFNMEIRGFPLFKVGGKGAENWELGGIHMTDRGLMTKWWENSYDGIPTDAQRKEKLALQLVKDVWYTLKIRLIATNVPNNWLNTIQVLQEKQKIWEIKGNIAGAGFSSIGSIQFGAEREHASGGIMLVSKAEVLSSEQ